MEGTEHFYNLFKHPSNTDSFKSSPVGDQFSLMVILVMTIGLGFPALVLFIGGMAIAIRNYRNGKDDLLFEQLNN
jgi:hypothetical protein